MKTMRYILFTITLLISVAAAAVEFGRPYRPTTPVFSTPTSNRFVPTTPVGARTPHMEGFYSTSVLEFNTCFPTYGDNEEGGSSTSSSRSRARRGYVDGGDEEDEKEGGYVIGTQKTDTDGRVYQWDGEQWVLIRDITEVQPIGDTPWLLLLLLCGGYAAFLSRRKRGDVLGLPA